MSSEFEIHTKDEMRSIGLTFMNENYYLEEN